MAKGGASRWTVERAARARELYDQGYSLAEIAQQLVSSTGRVAQAIRSAGGEIAPLGHPWTDEQRSEARALYEQGASIQEVADHFCIGTKKARTELKKAGTMMRNTGALGHRNRNWKGGRIVDKTGYVLLKMRDHPHATATGYVREHRLVMEQALGRYLKPGEVVHHKNGNRADNRLCNLELYESNGSHLAQELAGRVPKWTAAGLKRLSAYRRRPNQKG